MNGYIGTRNGIVNAPGLKGRGRNQNGRYREGVKSGELSGGERVALRGARKADRAHLAAAKADGSVSGAERLALHQDMTQTGQLLRAFKHN
jgi:uncharacterized membrane protein YebE (DUF533 family)